MTELKPKVRKAVRPVDVVDPEIEELTSEDADLSDGTAAFLEEAHSNRVAIVGDQIRAQVEKRLKLSLFEPENHFWLDLGSPYINSVFGSSKMGLPYGKVVELSGLEHCGKTLVSTFILGAGQRDGAAAGMIDLEESRDEKWATKLGVDWPALTMFYTKLVKQKTGPPKLLSVESICAQAEEAMYLLNKRGAEKQVWFLDSIAMMNTEEQIEVGAEGATMHSRLSRATMLSSLLPRWAGIAANYNALILVSNHLHMKVGGKVFGDPYETSGGRALRHVCSVRVRGRRLKGGRMLQGKKVIGLIGGLKNIKNKAGEGSVEGAECGFKVRWDKAKADVKFMSIKELNDELGLGEK